jgi:lipoate---protein ligase
LAENWRLIDTGLRPAAQNVALSRALLEARRAEESPSTLRFQRYTASALLGARHSAEQEFDPQYCRVHGIPVQRRITSGAAIYTNETQLSWELYLHARDLGDGQGQAIGRRLCHAAATAISALNVNARYRSGNEIEVEGRRISSAGLVSDGEGVLFQGTLAVDADAASALRVLRFTAAKPFETAQTLAAERETTLKILLGKAPAASLIKRFLIEAYESEFGVVFAESDLTLSEHARYERALREIDSADWIAFSARPAAEMPILEAVMPYVNGLVRATVMIEAPTQTIRQVWFSGDLAPTPARDIVDLEAALRDTPMSRVVRKVEWFFKSRPVEVAGLKPEDFIALVRRAAGRPLLARNP